MLTGGHATELVRKDHGEISWQPPPPPPPLLPPAPPAPVVCEKRCSKIWHGCLGSFAVGVPGSQFERCTSFCLQTCARTKTCARAKATLARLWSAYERRLCSGPGFTSRVGHCFADFLGLLAWTFDLIFQRKTDTKKERKQNDRQKESMTKQEPQRDRMQHT